MAQVKVKVECSGTFGLRASNVRRSALLGMRHLMLALHTQASRPLPVPLPPKKPLLMLVLLPASTASETASTADPRSSSSGATCVAAAAKMDHTKTTTITTKKVDMRRTTQLACLLRGSLHGHAHTASP